MCYVLKVFSVSFRNYLVDHCVLEQERMKPVRNLFVQASEMYASANFSSRSRLR